MGLHALNVDLQIVGRSHKPVGPIHDASGFSWEDMQTKYGPRFCTRRKEPLLQHQLGTPLFTGWRALLCRLEDKHDLARNFRPHARQYSRHPNQDRHMCVVPTRMHHARWLIVPSCGDL